MGHPGGGTNASQGRRHMRRSSALLARCLIRPGGRQDVLAADSNVDPYSLVLFFTVACNNLGLLITAEIEESWLCLERIRS